MDWIDSASAVLAAGIRLSMPIGIASVGECVTERAGIINVGIEGIMLIGAFVSVFGSVSTGSPWGGLGLALIVGALLAAVHAFFTIRLRADQIVAGVAMVILGLGLSGFFFRLTVGKAPVAIPGFTALPIAPLDELPLVGPALFDQPIPVYFGFAIVAMTSWFLSYTRFGLEIRAVGESPEAVEAAGISVGSRRFAATIFGGAMAGVAGAALAIGELDSFVENMVAGRGFIALACVVFGRWRPLGAFMAALGFGMAESLQIRLQIWFPNLPYQLLVVLPYIVAVGALVVLGREGGYPKALGRPY